MPDARRKRGSRARTRRRLALIGIGAFVLVDLGLVALALTREPSGLAADAEPAVTSTPLPVETTAAPEPTETPTPVAEAEAVTPTRLLSAVDDVTAWRAESGTCTPGTAGPSPTLELTTSAGATWSPLSVSTSGDPAAVDRVQATDAASAFVVGPAGTTCATAFAQTFSGGAEFRDYPERLAASWFVARSAPGTVHSPAGDRPAPCAAVVDLAVVSDTEAGVLCSDRRFFRTLDGARTWDAGTAVDGAVAITADAGEYLVAALGAASCEGTALEAPSATPGTVATRVGCAPVSSETPGSVALSGGGGSVWLWAGDDVLVSSDGGVTW
ncbi:hypothetical protein [Frigoribacterium sp. MCBA15_019]|uniref:hypothetical protein n=1 Tax=Frigoribacterium sp. MCBA15_019 TaxID=1898745 RepID=UPI0008DE201B|nr:hypothetical protein [Frigoribacterium sp. MCBA15_019]OII27590.1 hypothetical protein BIV04_03405 [Frigoribacterium sp. MCBA15_019]